MSSPNPPGKIDAELLVALIKMDERLAAGDVIDPLTDADANLVSADIADCLRLLNDVRQTSPLLLADSQPCEGTSGLWLNSDGDLPKKIGRFQVLRQLGKGGFGIVFLALDPELDRLVALKVPRIEALVRPGARRRFIREAKAVARLDHANIAAIYECGSVGPICYIASAYCPGNSLADAFAIYPFSLSHRSAAWLMISIAEAVQHAHSRGIIHRDLKPSNVLIDAAPEEIEPLFSLPQELARRVRLVDFGLSASSTSSNDSSQSGVVLGTPAYMAPEQAFGQSATVGPAADIYGLGAILYWLLTGQAPFEKSSDLEKLVAFHRDSPVSTRRHDPSIPRDLDAICQQCLRKSPEQRYASATDLAADLERFLTGQPVRARSIGLWERTRRWCRAKPAVALLSLLLLVCLTALWIGSLGMANRFRGQRDELVLSLARAEEAERTASEMVELLRLKMDALNGEDVVAGWTKIIDSGSASGRALTARGEAYMRQGKYDLALADFERAIGLEPGFPWGKLYASWVLSVGSADLREADRAVQLAEEGLAFFSDRPWSALHVLGYAYYRQGRVQEARAVLKEAIEQRTDGGHSIMLFFLAMCHHQLGNQQDAIECFESGMEKSNGSSELSFHLIYAVREEAKSVLAGE